MTTTQTPAPALTAVTGTDDYATADGRFYVRRTAATPFTSEGFEISDKQTPGYQPGEHGLPWAETLEQARNIVGEIADGTPEPVEPVAPVRGDSVLVAHGDATHRTADGRFTVEIDPGGDGFERIVLDRGEIGARVADLDAARRLIATAVDGEHRRAQLAYTRELAEIDPAVAAQVVEMRYRAALHGKVTGSTGGYQTEQRGRMPGAVELTVYVARDQYADAIEAMNPAPADDAEPAGDVRGAYVDDLRVQLTSVLESVAALLRADGDALLANRHDIRDLADAAEQLATRVTA